MKKMIKSLIFCSLVWCLFGLLIPAAPKMLHPLIPKNIQQFWRKDVSVTQKDLHLSSPDAQSLPFRGSFQFYTEPLDGLGRAKSGHVQMQWKDKVGDDNRPKKITVNPVGWHNIQSVIPQTHQKYWVMNRGHLVGYQFCAQNNNLANLVPETLWLNDGGYTFNEKNKQAMPFYEQGLAHWMEEHPNDWLDYQVRAIYQGNELIPRQVQLIYEGLSANGSTHIPIHLGSTIETMKGDETSVVLANRDPNPNIKIDYVTGKVMRE